MKYSKYPSYKDSGVEWLGSLPVDWKKLPIKYIGKLNAGVGFPHSEQGNEAKELPFYKVNALAKSDINDYLTNKENTVSEATAKQLGAFIFPIDSIVFAKVGAALLLSRIRWVKFRSCLDNNMMGLVVNNKNFTKFIKYAMNTIKFDYLVNPGAIPSLNESQIGNFYLAIPPLQEQKAIATYLDRATQKIDTLIAKQSSLIALLKEKRQALISHAVTKGVENHNGDWTNYRLDWVSTIIRGNTGFKKDELKNSGEYVALQYGKTYKVDEVNQTFNFYVNSEFYKQRQLVHKGDTILISTSETVEDLGHSCFYNRDDLGLIGGEQILLKPNVELINDKYLYYSSKVFCKELKKYASGLKVFRFNTDDLKKIFISIPSVEEQQEIAKYLDQKTQKIDTLITKATGAITLLKEKRTALISAVVTGKVKVNGEAREGALGQDVRGEEV